jgi:hypothetical protein
MTTDAAAVAPATVRSNTPGILLAAVVFCIYGGLALSVDFPRAALGIQSDEATYYMLGHSLAQDGDLEYRREDLVRVWEEFPSGPSGLFLKKGKDVVDWGLMRRRPFFWTSTNPDPVPGRLYYGKSFIYPLFAAPFVRVFGTNGFLVLHAVLLTLVVWCAYLFLRERMPATIAAALAGAFVMATVVPVYFVWITPELFNFSLGLLAYFCWLYKEVSQPPVRPSWLHDGRSDVVAALLLGIATFSKPTNALMVVPIALLLLWRRQIGRTAIVSALFFAAAVGLFAANMASAGEWNYQGGDRKTFMFEFPFQTPRSNFDIVPQTHGRDDALTDIIFGPMFWTNLRHNAVWFFTGRNAGLMPYFFPAVFALLAFAVGWKRRPLWQYLVLASALAQIAVFVITVPYTWNGGGGSVGNRYFMGAYGIFVFLIPPITRTAVAIVPWLVGALFTAPLVLNPFVTSFRPGDHPKSGPFRWLPIELSLVWDWPINTQEDRRRRWFGDNPKGSSPGFQITFFDDNAFIEGDGTFWVRGESRADVVIKTDRPMKRLQLEFTAGHERVEVEAAFSGRSQRVTLGPGETQQIAFAMPTGFVYQGIWPVWTASVSASSGFVPLFYGEAKDNRYLGVRVKPTLVE